MGCTVTGAGYTRTLDVFGCSPDLTAGENGGMTASACPCVQGTYLPVGCCCAFTVPTGVTSVTVELWGGGGGGGSGASANCCGINPGGGAGTYVKRNFPVVAGDVLTLCAGAGGCGAPFCEGQDSFCCCGARGGCSFVQRNGSFCADAQGGAGGISQCYMTCGCMYYSNCGTKWGVGGFGGPCADNGAWTGCTGYSADLQVGGSNSGTPGCNGNSSTQISYAASAAFGGDAQYSYFNCQCWGYIKFNSSCTNTAGVAGRGGDPGAAAASGTTSAYNIPGTTNYTCSSTDYSNCARIMPGLPGQFPGGGGTSGATTTCCWNHSAGGNGASGYVRIWY